MPDAYEAQVRVKRAYRERFGRDSLQYFSSFTQDREEVRTVLERALSRGTPATADEIAWLNRNVVEGVEY